MNAHLPKLTHAAAIGLGLALAMLIGRQSSATASSTADAGAGPSSRKSSAATDPQEQLDRLLRRPKLLRASEYRRAWDSIADQELSPGQRIMLQVTLLQQWAEVDLEGALTAAFDTSWDGDRGYGGIQTLLGAFDRQFAKRPTESWDLITSGKFGLGAALAKGRWAESVIAENPLLVADVIRQIPLGTRRSVFPQVLEAIKQDPSKIGSFYDKLCELPQDKTYLDFVRQTIGALGVRGTTDDIRTKYAEATTDAQRSILVHEFGESLANADLDAVRGQLAQLPEADRGRMLRSVAMHAKAGEQTPQLVEMLLQTGNYNDVQGQANQYLREYASDPAKQVSLARWAINLPQGPGATQVVHRSVERYFAADPQGGRAWLETLPTTNWTRNIALAEYSQQMLYKHNDPEASAWALSQINDPKVQKDATSWRGAWERQQRR